jgi:phospholipase C
LLKKCVYGFPSRAFLSILCSAVPLLLVTGCYEFQITGGTAEPAISISAQPDSIEDGSSSTLTIAAKNADQVTVTGSDGSSYNLPAGGGSQVVNPSDTTTYTALATGATGNKSASVSVNVASTSAPVVTIAADPDEILPGSSSMLKVTATNATTVLVAGTDGSRYTLQATGGAQKVTPATSTIYTATATGAAGKASAKATVTVTADPVPYAMITADPPSIHDGGSSTLTITARYATSVAVSGTNGAEFTLGAKGGTQKVTPIKTTTYTVTASGTGGKFAAKATVEVKPPAPTVEVTAYPKSINAGSSSVLTVTAKNATEVTVTGSNGRKFTMPVTGGKHAVSPASTTTFTVTASGAGGKASAAATVTVTPNPPPTVKITATPSSIKAGSSSTLTVTAAHSTEVTVKGSDGSKYSLKSTGGLVAVTPKATTTYTATATGPGGSDSDSAKVTVTDSPVPSVTVIANPTTITSGNSSTLVVTATNATQVTIAGTDGSSYSLQPDGGSQVVSPTITVTYTATATGPGGIEKSSATVTVDPAASLQSIDHVIFMLQENHTFDNYFGMLNNYRNSMKWSVGDDGVTYSVDGIEDKLTTISDPDDEGTPYTLFKLTSTCIDDDSSDWLASYGDVNRYDFLTTRPIQENGFVHTAEGYAKSCAQSGTCSGSYTDLTGERAMGYYDEDVLNYYYYMASQFALSDRWFSPVSSKSIDNRIATFTGGTTQGLTKDPANDHLSQLAIPTIFEELDTANVSWKIYYTVTQGFCLDEDDCPGGGSNEYPATDFSNLTYSYRYLYENPSGDPCTAPTQGSEAAVQDPTNSFCIDTEHIAPLSDFFSDLKNGTLPSFAFIEAGYGKNDEHPGSGQSVLLGQAEVANILNSFMASPEWSDSVFFLSYDEGGGPYDHVPPVPGHSNDNTDASLGTIPDISLIAVNPDVDPKYYPCVPAGGTPTLHCDLVSTDPGANSGDAPAVDGFGAQLGFRLPNMIISPFTRRHYVSHAPMDHTAVIKFVENRFIGSAAHLTARDAAQPDLLDFFDFTATPWATPPTPPTPASDPPGTNSCTAGSMGP